MIHFVTHYVPVERVTKGKAWECTSRWLIIHTHICLCVTHGIVVCGGLLLCLIIYTYLVHYCQILLYRVELKVCRAFFMQCFWKCAWWQIASIHTHTHKVCTFHSQVLNWTASFTLFLLYYLTTICYCV